MSITLILLIIFCLVGILFMRNSVKHPSKLLGKAAVNSLLGIGLLWLLNSLGHFIGLSIPLNVFTVLVTGALGVPGLAMLGILQVIVK